MTGLPQASQAGHPAASPLSWLRRPGVWLMALALLGAGLYFRAGIATLLDAWALPEYSHGPVIPLLSLILFLRQLRDDPAPAGAVRDRGPGVLLVIAALGLGAAGIALGIGDIVAYGLILWIGGLVLIGFGWARGRAYWPPVLHLAYMLPLPGALYYGVSTALQGVSSELGVWFLRQLQVPVYLSGNIIDLGVVRLHVAEACSGLRYLFPILSFSYIFAVLYRGPVWHKAVLLLAAVPIAIVMNSVRIALAGVIVTHWGLGHLDGFSHFFEGWVIFLASVLILFLLAWLLVALRRDGTGLRAAMDVDFAEIVPQLARLGRLQASRGLAAAALLGLAGAAAVALVPERQAAFVARDPFALFPERLGAWEAGPRAILAPETARILAADDYHAVTLIRPDDAPDTPPVELFIAWYKDQMSGGTHSPELCLPGAGWEIAALRPVEVSPPGSAPFRLNRAVIQQGATRQLVYYWFEQQGQRTASGFAAKLQLMLGKLANGRGDSALVRLITPIGLDGEAAAEARLAAALADVLPPLPRFVPGLGAGPGDGTGGTAPP
jgi:exosortase D (VPLPA-CTERM-specific)